MQNLLNQFSQRVFLDETLKERIRESFELFQPEKGEVILQEGTRANYLYFVEEGILHNYYYHNQKEVTSWFYHEDQFVMAWSGFYLQQTSFESIKCLEDCKLYRISYSDYQKLIEEFPTFQNFARMLAEEMVAFLDEFSKGWSFLSAKEKYNLLTRYFPQIELRVKYGLIASFLGISQETLSRIRSEK